MTRLYECLDFTLKEEGGFVNDPRDPGGATNFGITLRNLSAYLNREVSVDELKTINGDTVTAFYRTQFWHFLYGDFLPKGVDLMVFDFAVNVGPQKSIKLLQSVVGSKVDGLLGPKTLAAVQATSPVGCIYHLADDQSSYYRSLGNFHVFGNDWIDRTGRRKETALQQIGV